MRASGYFAGGLLALGIGVGLFLGHGVASAVPDAGASADKSVTKPAAKSARQAVRHESARNQSRHTTRPPAARTDPRIALSREIPTATETVAVTLPPMPVVSGASFTVSADFIKPFATNFIAAGGDPADSARFFFGDLAVKSLDALARENIPEQQTRLLLGNLAASGYFGGIWLRDNLHTTPTDIPAIVLPPAPPLVAGLSPSAIGMRLFDAVSAGLAGAAASAPDWVVSTIAHVSVPVLLALYGYNRGYLQVVLEHPPAGVPPMQDMLACNGFLDCNSTAFPLDLASRYDSVLDKLGDPTGPGWVEMSMWTTVLHGATEAGRFVWEGLARAGFSPASYTALVQLSSAYLMVSKAAVLSSMTAYADGDATIGRSSLRLQAGLWMWSGAYFAGLAASAAPGTIPKVVVS
ncbi:hypothetical protein [Mycolicibacterium sp. P1-5]|uniref:hypothetical protein n=1 Tax=Mycolicibacterium sp. P1-5 TaxID=2024617 RepID=UPI0011EDA547|nr:hypothetical protein [Mycolicibacterium sp. P1-5]KAA0108681.1 hypothetical protein CIW47_14050 [Mycolicibacterium sp. P1-5]